MALTLGVEFHKRHYLIIFKKSKQLKKYQAAEKGKNEAAEESSITFL